MGGAPPRSITHVEHTRLPIGLPGLVALIKRFVQVWVKKRDALEARGGHVMRENTTKILPERNDKEGRMPVKNTRTCFNQPCD